MNTEDKNMLDSCVKIIEVDDNGQLVLLEDGFSKLIAGTKKYTEFLKASFLSYIGSATCNKGIFTKLFARKAEGDQMWSEVSKNPIKTTTNVLTDRKSYEEKSQNGVYWWPEIITLSENSNTTVILVFHVNTDGLDEHKTNDPLYKFVNEISTCCVNIVSSKTDYMSVYSQFSESGILHSHLTSDLNKHFILKTKDLYFDKRKCVGASFDFYNNTHKMVQKLSSEHSAHITKIRTYLELSINAINTCNSNFQKNNLSCNTIGPCSSTVQEQVAPFEAPAMEKIHPNENGINKNACLKRQNCLHSTNKNRKKLITFYEAEMNKVLALGKPLCPDLLLEVHNTFLEEMCKILGFSASNANDRIQFSNEVLEVFKKFSASNLEIIGRLQNKVRSIIASYKSKYEIQMDTLIHEVCAKNIVIEFCKEHDNIYGALKLQMTNALETELSYNEPVHMHVHTLEKSILKSSKSFISRVPSSLLKKSKYPSQSTKLNMEHFDSTSKIPLVLHNLVQENPVSDDPVPKDPLPENVIPKDTFPEDPIPKDAVPENVIPKDPVSQDSFLGDPASEDPVLKQAPRNNSAGNQINTANIQKTNQTKTVKPEEKANKQVKRLKRDAKIDQHTNQQTEFLPEETTPLPSKKHAILLHLCGTRIGISTVEESLTYNKPEKLHETLYVSSKFAVTTDNKWLYGQTLTSNADIKYNWNIGNFLKCNESKNSKHEFSDLPYNPMASQVLPLALLLSALKHNAELKKDVVITRLIVAVPRWLSCQNRQLILDAASLARFQLNQCYLINEAACSAFYHFKVNKLNQPYNAVIVSENASTIDLTVYLYDDTNDNLTLCDHSSKAYKMVNSQICLYDNSSDKVGRNKISQIEYFVNVQKAIGRAEKKGHKVNVCSIALGLAESSTTEIAIKCALLNDSSKPYVKVKNELVLFGLSKILNVINEQNGSSLDLSLKENFHVHINVVDRANKHLYSENIKWEYETKHCIELPYKEDPYEYFVNEIIAESIFCIGVLQLNEFAIPFPKPKKIRMVFSCDLNGIMTLRRVLYTVNKNTNELNGSRYTWTTRNILANQIHNEKVMFDEISNCNISLLKIEKQIAEAIQLGQEISKRIKSQHGDFRGPNIEFERLLVQQQVDVSIKALMKEVSNEDVLKSNREILLNIKQQYKL